MLGWTSETHRVANLGLAFRNPPPNGSGQGRNRALTVSYVPSWLDSGPQIWKHNSHMEEENVHKEPSGPVLLLLFSSEEVTT